VLFWVRFVDVVLVQGLLSKFHTLHVILADLFDAMVQGLLPLQASLFTQPCRNNALYLLALVDELVMGDAFRLLPVSFLMTMPNSFICYFVSFLLLQF